MNHLTNKKPTNSQQIAALIGLIGFGIIFDQITDQVNRRIEQKSSLLVVIGVAITVTARQRLPIGLRHDFLAFACSGTPMIAGQLTRYSRRRRRALQRRDQDDQ